MTRDWVTGGSNARQLQEPRFRESIYTWDLLMYIEDDGTYIPFAGCPFGSGVLGRQGVRIESRLEDRSDTTKIS